MPKAQVVTHTIHHPGGSCHVSIVVAVKRPADRPAGSELAQEDNRTDARTLADWLGANLPNGTYDRLLSRMLGEMMREWELKAADENQDAVLGSITTLRMVLPHPDDKED